MAPALGRGAKVRRLAPLARLSPAALEALLGDAPVLEFGSGEIVYSQDEEDDFVHYLLEGVVEALWNGKLVKSVDVNHAAARRPLDPPGPKRYTLRARTDASILRVTRSALERQLRLADLTSGRSALRVAEDPAWTSSDWMTRLLQSRLFVHLPAQSIQRIFERMERIRVSAGDVIVRQGEAGDYYYVIETGQCQVSRQPSNGGNEVHLADLGPGFAFGEEALIANVRRNANVRMRTDGRLLRLDAASFRELIRDPLIHGVNQAEGQRLVEEGGVWLDIRYPEQFAWRAFENAVNIPLTVLRVQCRTLDREKPYVVCSDDPGSSAVGAFLLAQRGYRTSYLNQPCSDLHMERDAAVEADTSDNHPTVEGTAGGEGDDMNEHRRPRPHGEADDGMDLQIPGFSDPDGSGTGGPGEPIARELFAETEVGQSLADLIEDMDARRRDLEGESGVAEAAPELGGLDDTEPGSAAASLGASAAPERVSGPAPGAVQVEAGHDELSRLMRELERRVRDHVERRVDAHREQLEKRLHERVAGVKQAAAQQIRKNAEAVRRAFEQDYAQKRAALRRDYERLLRLANKVSRQKAEIQQARRDLEKKLKIANQLHKEVDEIRSVLTQRIGNIEGLESRGEPAGHPL